MSTNTQGAVVRSFTYGNTTQTHQSAVLLSPGKVRGTWCAAVAIVTWVNTRATVIRLRHPGLTPLCRCWLSARTRTLHTHSRVRALTRSRTVSLRFANHSNLPSFPSHHYLSTGTHNDTHKHAH